VKKKKADNLIRYVVVAYQISKYISENENERYENFYDLIKGIMKLIA
jgi:hypothetical protein